MDENIDLNITFDQNRKPLHNLIIKRKHLGGNKEHEWYNEVNSDYIRIYLPKGSQIIEALGNSYEYIAPPLDYESLKFKQDETVVAIEATLEKEPLSGVDIFEESGKTVVGGWLYTSPGEETVFKLTYQVPDSIIKNSGIDKLPGAETENLNYNLIFQRQPGTIKVPLRLAIDYPESWRVKQVYPRTSLISQNPVRFREAVDVDKFFNVDFKVYK